jgi:hypothetical protein
MRFARSWSASATTWARWTSTPAPSRSGPSTTETLRQAARLRRQDHPPGRLRLPAQTAGRAQLLQQARHLGVSGAAAGIARKVRPDHLPGGARGVRQGPARGGREQRLPDLRLLLPRPGARRPGARHQRAPEALDRTRSDQRARDHQHARLPRRHPGAGPARGRRRRREHPGLLDDDEIEAVMERIIEPRRPGQEPLRPRRQEDRLLPGQRHLLQRPGRGRAQAAAGPRHPALHARHPAGLVPGPVRRQERLRRRGRGGAAGHKEINRTNLHPMRSGSRGLGCAASAEWH